MMQLEVVKEIPFDTIYLHSLVRDEKGVKMSKTLGNVVDPLDLVDEFGADALRFTMTSMAALGGTLKLSTDRVKGNRNFGTKLWNAARFAEFNEASPVEGFDPASVEQTLNKWIVGETAKVREVVFMLLFGARFVIGMWSCPSRCCKVMMRRRLQKPRRRCLGFWTSV